MMEHTAVTSAVECYYCNKKAVWVTTINDEADHITYIYEKCDDHKDVKDHTMSGIELWKKKWSIE